VLQSQHLSQRENFPYSIIIIEMYLMQGAGQTEAQIKTVTKIRTPHETDTKSNNTSYWYINREL